MKELEIVKNLIYELGNNEDMGFNFSTSRNGIQCGFTPQFNILSKEWANNIRINNKKLKNNIETDNLTKVVKQCIINLYTEQELENFDKNCIEIFSKLKSYIIDTAIKILETYTHYIPVDTLGMEKIKKIKIDTIEILSIEDWIDSIDISGKECFDDFDWKKYLHDSLKNQNSNKPNKPCDDIIESIFDFIEKTPALIKITIKGYEKDFSYKLANIVAKTTLDSLSLLFNEDVFYQQILLSERIIPISSMRMVETNGKLWLPGLSLSQRIPMIAPLKAYEELNNDRNKDFMKSLSTILNSLMNSERSKYPKLSSRWATALDWYAEGIREQNDAIAVTKIATSLDVLSNGGKYKGILNMLINIFDCNEEDILIDNLTVKEFVRLIYDASRSQILHGTHHERLKSFSIERKQSTQLVKRVLWGCLLFLHEYTGEDLDKGFREIIKFVNEEDENV